MSKLSINDLTGLHGKRVLVRVDFNVPLDDKGAITDDTRIKETLPTIHHLAGQGALVILMSHLGRPDGKVVESMSLKPVAARLSEMLKRPVAFASDCIGEPVAKAVAAMKPGDVLLLENTRFHAEEESNEEQFAKQLAAVGDIYVNDAFGTAHRAHASTAGVCKFIKTCAAGFLLQKEIKYLGEELASPEKPCLVILGGAKVSDKIGVINNLISKADGFLIGGAMAYTFLKAQGVGIGSSLVEEDRLGVAKETLAQVRAKGAKFLLPVDHVAGQKVETPVPGKKKPQISFKNVIQTPDATIEVGYSGVDIGPKTVEMYRGEIAKAKTIVWNGPMGIFEMPEFATGTFEVAKAVAVATQAGAKSIIGGGDSIKAVKKAKVADQITFISTGGGASLEFLEGRDLPGIAALTDK
ncbi:MAG: phosphoglycerate kinase [Verrucomicrobiae bacterium]|nr:phosphoglycerate kinase [Verrucomicrobiae bacterium]